MNVLSSLRIELPTALAVELMVVLAFLVTLPLVRLFRRPAPCDEPEALFV